MPRLFNITSLNALLKLLLATVIDDAGLILLQVDSLKKVTEDDGDKTSIKEETITMGDEDKEEEKPDAPVAVAVVAPPEPDEVRDDVVEDVVTEIVDDVIRSDQDVPSVPQVVMESFDELVQEDINAQV